MKSISKDLLGLLTTIFVLFGPDIVDLGAYSIPSVSTDSKILAVLSATIIVAGWKFWARHSIYLPLLLVIGTSLALSVRYGPGQPIHFFGFIETFLLGILVYFAHSVSNWISHISEELEKMLLNDIHKPIAKLPDSFDDINTYLYQSRRSGYPLSVIVLDIKENCNKISLSHYQRILLRELSERYLKRYLKTRLINQIVAGFRRSDMIVMSTEHDSKLLIMCPSTTLEACNALAQRIQTTAKEDLDLPVSAGAASFPTDGFTLEALINAAEMSLVDGKPSVPVEETEEQAA
ncbi:hypothetical protein sS8_0272 [Methylocaldum marinum]|uniref:GGDEF domain-containing protein n=1 Tax=Methylocaldum marinum TaxID=1432792 RepID=A0A286P3L8_9GAMM|nr:hypothetical protein [Methylocaldum marinum]BBA32240.1 hypothetical protein sS8_0272 [Methylocaldum marinum]